MTIASRRDATRSWVTRPRDEVEPEVRPSIAVPVRSPWVERALRQELAARPRGLVAPPRIS